MCDPFNGHTTQMDSKRHTLYVHRKIHILFFLEPSPGIRTSSYIEFMHKVGLGIKSSCC